MSNDKLSVFDFVNSISFGKKEFTDEEIKRYYDPYVTIMAFANFPDTIHIANALNCFSSPISKKNHFLFLFHMIRKKKRFSQFYKKEAERKKRVEIICEYYNCSINHAEDIIGILSDDDIEYMKTYMNDFGGIVKTKKMK